MLEWQLSLLIMFGSLLVLMMVGMPVAVCFMFLNIIGVVLLWGGEAGLRQLILSIFSSVTTFTLLPVPMFVLMGEVIFHSGIALRMIDVLDAWIGRVPGRLGLLAVGGGTLFATLTGASMASTAMLGSVLVPEMEKRGYRKPMSLGPILGSGGLAIMIPPSSLAVLVGAIGEISIGRILIATIVPGLMMAALYATYIVVRCLLQPSLAPSYDVPPVPLLRRIAGFVRYILPAAFVVFMVVGVIFLGIATPTEAAASGALSTFILAAAYRRLSWGMMKKAFSGALRITGMIFLIITGATAFAQILAYTGATRGLGELAVSLPVAPIVIMIAMQVVVLFLGCFMDVVAIMMVTLPVFMPAVQALGFNSVWFAAVFLLNLEMAATSPPFGLNLFVMKAVAPPGTTMGDCYAAALPFLGCDLIAMATLLAFPAVALWLPGLML